MEEIVLGDSQSALHRGVHHVAVNGEPAEGQLGHHGLLSYFVWMYYPDVTEDTDFTCRDNHYVKTNYGDPFRQYMGFNISFTDGPTTVERLLLGAAQAFPDVLRCQTIHTDVGNRVKAMTIKDRYTQENKKYTLTADLKNPCYGSVTEPNSSLVQWIFSLDGLVGTEEALPDQASKQSIDARELVPLTHVYWQLVAPDSSYGF